MSKEQPPPSEPFAFNEREKLFNQMSEHRFQQLLADEQTTIHTVRPDSNSFGEFLFITVSRPEAGQRQFWTFYGCGYHEFRERWYSQEWAWFQDHPFAETTARRISREEAEALLQARRDEIAPDAHEAIQTGRGKLFEIIADLTDEDGALAEMDDLGDLWDELSDGLE